MELIEDISILTSKCWYLPDAHTNLNHSYISHLLFHVNWTWQFGLFTIWTSAILFPYVTAASPNDQVQLTWYFHWRKAQFVFPHKFRLLKRGCVLEDSKGVIINYLKERHECWFNVSFVGWFMDMPSLQIMEKGNQERNIKLGGTSSESSKWNQEVEVNVVVLKGYLTVK